MKSVPLDLSPARSAIGWWFQAPRSSHVCITASLDFSGARGWMRSLEEAGRPITVTHLVTACVVRVLHEFPQANAWVLRGRIHPVQDVGALLPVDLLDHPGEALAELSATLLPRAQRLTVCELARRTRKQVTTSREGEVDNRLLATFSQVGTRLPPAALRRFMDLCHLLNRQAFTARFLYRLLPVTTLVTNPGVTFRERDVGLLRAVAIPVPDRLLHLGTLWGVSRIQDEVMAVDGRPEVRPALPLVFCFDHRLIDGVIAGRLLARFAEILQNPRPVFGALGDRPLDAPPAPTGNEQAHTP